MSQFSLGRPGIGAALFAGILACFGFLNRAGAQTGPELLFKPWPKGQFVQTEDYATFLNEGSTHAVDDFKLDVYDSNGRARLLPGHRADPRFGWNYTDLNTSGDPALPSHFIDTSVAFGMGVADFDGWLAGVTVGLGYAGAGGFDDADAWYGLANVIVGHEFGKDNSLGLVLSYDGNRTFMPDVPLPGFLYTKRVYPEVLIGLGFPFSSVEYKPFGENKLTLYGEYYFPDELRARIDYEVIKDFGLFAEYNTRRDAFHWDELGNGEDRVIYITKRAELGVRWTPFAEASLVVAGGYAFDQEFNVGFDTRDQDRIVKPSDEPYVRAGFEVRF